MPFGFEHLYTNIHRLKKEKFLKCMIERAMRAKKERNVQRRIKKRNKINYELTFVKRLSFISSYSLVFFFY